MRLTTAVRNLASIVLRDPPAVPGLPRARWIHRLAMDDGAKVAVHEVRSYSFSYEDAPSSAPTTLILVHGFNLTAASCFFQLAAVREIPNLRILLPDLRGHGASETTPGPNGPQPMPGLDIERTAIDLAETIRTLAPTGRLILAGHSMGAMTVLGVLRHLSREDRQRIGGITLVNGAIDTFASKGVSRILHSPLVRAVRWLGAQSPSQLEWAKSLVEWAIKPVIAAFIYHGSLDDGASDDFDVLSFHANEIANTPMPTLLGYLDDLTEHDELATAELLADIPGEILVGAMDDVTPPSQSRRIHELWPRADLHEYPESGHMLPVERPEDVNRALLNLLG